MISPSRRLEDTISRFQKDERRRFLATADLSHHARLRRKASRQCLSWSGSITQASQIRADPPGYSARSLRHRPKIHGSQERAVDSTFRFSLSSLEIARARRPAARGVCPTFPMECPWPRCRHAKSFSGPLELCMAVSIDVLLFSHGRRRGGGSATVVLCSRPLCPSLSLTRS